ncbi:hypothetical protein DVH07_05030 [Hafnia paralvei]|jgi:hypothetical protein|uniref:hypothetical protein n=1 Tax=Hafnia paralvei TaxID=546367 RepID=UPI000DF3AA83|nr:hypothetical protein [Hafnia paralvei]RDA69974.1 hypothetical protein DU449_05030 [Hafnia paralvei]RDA70802.1 hypothetical protein DVH09_05415 [Hafnia paralvei]RDA73759.1 hypothetical protein DVH08_00605 [Hafnia paralvei]RDA80237.1 hypothetical protein DVH10_04880 [Hafnia paralvei]RDA80585.1 hypothetical protein DVH07_05030 [Hafnia paralvei]
MKIAKLLTGHKFDSLITCANSAEKHLKENKADILTTRNDYLNKLKSDSIHLSLLTIAVYIAINMMLNFLSILPYTIISISFNIPTPIMVAQIYIPLMLFWVTSVFSFKIILKGRSIGLIIYKYMFLTECFLFFLSLFFYTSTEKDYWQIKITNAGILLWCRSLMNSRSFDGLVKFYIYRRLSTSLPLFRIKKPQL